MSQLCKQCGKRLDNSVKFCSCCGALNPQNIEIQTIAVEQNVEITQATKKFISGFLVFGILFGALFLIVHMVLLFVAPFSFMKVEAFGGAVAAGMMMVFSIIGLSKKEGVVKGVFISGGISLGMLLMNIFLML